MTTPDTLERLRAANPAAVRKEDGRGPAAQAGLQRILADDDRSGVDPGSITPRQPGRRAPRAPRGLALVLAALVVGGGAAVAATDPFGWRSANPDTAKYRVNPALRVRTPSAQEITCRPVASGFRCRVGSRGQVYYRTDSIRAPSHDLTRVRLLRAITSGLADGRVTAAQAKTFRAHLAAVPESFFTQLGVAFRYQTMGGGPGRVPPPGVPSFLVCEDAGRALACQDLNGDLSAPVGAGIYQAMPTGDWRREPPQQRDLGLPPGVSFTRAEYRVLIDLLRLGRGENVSGPRSALKVVNAPQTRGPRARRSPQAARPRASH